MTEPKRIQRSRAKGWRMPEGAVIVDRTTPWGNPFVVGRDGTRAECVESYQRLLCGLITVSGNAPVKDQQEAFNYAAKHLGELRGRDLACWCSLPKPGEPDICHAAILLRIANSPKCEEVVT